VLPVSSERGRRELVGSSIDRGWASLSTELEGRSRGRGSRRSTAVVAGERASVQLPCTAHRRREDDRWTHMHMHAQTSEFSFFVFPVIVQERAGIRACTRVRRTASRGPGRTDVSSILVCN
jgi:hypothetical protein